MKKRIAFIAISFILFLTLLAGCEWFTEMGRNNPNDPDSAWIGSHSPVSGATAVAIDAAVTVTFLRDLSDATVTAATFTMAAGETAVEGTPVYTDTDKVLTFTPSANLAYSTTYTVTIPASGITDLEGNTLLTAYTWSFTTAAAPAEPEPEPDPEPSGSLDLTFNDGIGFVMPLKYPSNNDYVNDMIIQDDGSILLGGYTDSYRSLIRFDEDGNLDSTLTGDWSNYEYPGEGYIQFNQINGISAIMEQSDGKILLAFTNGSSVEIARFSPTGAVDRGFDGGPFAIMDGSTEFNGFISFIPEDGTSGHDLSTVYISKLFEVSGGKIIAVGYVATDLNGHAAGYQDTLILRFNADGSLDETFGDGDGCRTYNFGTQNLYIHDAALDSQGRIVACGYLETTYDGIVFRFAADGTLDTTFNASGTPGYVVESWTDNIEYRAIAIDSAGRIVVTGLNNTTTTSIAVARYNADGTLDTSFDGDSTGDGKFEIDPAPGNSYSVNDILIDENDRILISGSINGDWDIALLRLTTTGVLDSSFDGPENMINYPGNGFLQIDLGANPESFRRIAIDSENRIVAAGIRNYNGTIEPVVFRFWP